MKKMTTIQKDFAKYILEKLGVSRPYVLDFEHNDRVYLFAGDGEVKRYISPGCKLHEVIESIEQCFNVKVYAVTHEYSDIIGESYSFLCVSPFEEDWVFMFQRANAQTFVVYAFVWNVNNVDFSEFGSVRLEAHSGTIRRVW